MIEIEINRNICISSRFKCENTVRNVRRILVSLTSGFNSNVIVSIVRFGQIWDLCMFSVLFIYFVQIPEPCSIENNTHLTITSRPVYI
jgi:hypothetical protein